MKADSDHRTRELHNKARRLIPGGAQLFTKRPELHHPRRWPAYFSKAKGAEIWDLDGNRLVDMSYSGIGSVTLGYADPDVTAAVIRAVEAGSMTTLNCAEDVELAELFVELHPWAEMVRFVRTGGEAIAVAVRIARAATGRAFIAFCGYHGWHDWYLAANLKSGTELDEHLLAGLPPEGVPGHLGGTAFPFRYNRIQELEKIVATHGSELAAIVMEPIRNDPPEDGFLEKVRAVADRCGAVLVFDEITAAMRLRTGGAHVEFGVNPDVAVFAKGISNGHPMAAVIGRAELMRAAESTFISSTYWTERVGPVAALATLRKHRELNVASRLIAAGERIQNGWRELLRRWEIPGRVFGIAPLAHLQFDTANSQAVRTLFTQLMLDRGYLATGAFYASLAHSNEIIDAYLANADDAFKELKAAIESESVESRIDGPVAQSGFRRLN